MHGVTAATFYERSAGSRGVLASYDTVTPSREIRSTDVQRLSFPLQIVIGIVTATIIGTGSVWAITSGLRSDVRDILTRMQMQDELTKTQRQLQDERLKILSDTVQDLKRRVELMQYEVQNASTKRSLK